MSVIGADNIAELCFRKFNSLARTGKPTQHEWTVLSCIVQHSSTQNVSKVVSLGTGTKCVGSDQLCAKGLNLNDSHAEIMARRGFLRYLYAKLNDSQADILNYQAETKRFNLADDITFHFFSTHPPCGDASVATKRWSSEKGEPSIKRTKLSGDEQFTGAKLLVANRNNGDLMSQDEGAIRTKPGRGVRTLSVSCSDKLSRWNVLGVQGALLDCLLDKPIYLISYTFCGAKIDELSVSRAIWERWSHEEFEHERFKVQRPEVTVASDAIDFEWKQMDGKEPSPTSIVWCDVPERSMEVSVGGKRQGVTKSKRNTLTGSLKISKAYLLQNFISVVSNRPELLERFEISSESITGMTYAQVKKLSTEYQSAWNDLKKNVFHNWTEKLSCLLEFNLVDSL